MRLTEGEIQLLLSQPASSSALAHYSLAWPKLGAEQYLYLALMAPAMDMALADSRISLYEELVLRRKAQMFTKGALFFRNTPVALAMRQAITDFEQYRSDFYAFLKVLIHKCAPPQASGKVHKDEAYQVLMQSPYLLTRLLHVLFLTEEDDLFVSRSIARTEFECMSHIATVLDIAHWSVYQAFRCTFAIT